MKTLRPRARLALIFVIGLVAVAPANVQAFDPQPEPPLVKAQASKLKASGKLARCETNVLVKHLLGAFDPQPEPPRADLLAKCTTKFVNAFDKAESTCAASGATCPQGDPVAIAGVIGPIGPHLEAFLAQEVGALRFVGNGDGTVTDTKTGLQWEQKTGTVAAAISCSTSSCTDPHDVNNRYQWAPSGTGPNGSAFFDFLGKLNACESADGSTATGGFAGHCDWRLPTIVELQTIVDLDAAGCGSGSPCIDPILGGSLAPFWSDTTADNPLNAWSVFFQNGLVFNGYKYNDYAARAVRGGP